MRILMGYVMAAMKLNLVRLDDKAFQDKMEVLEQFFGQLKEEIYKAREEGYENTQIINKSETFFTICDETTGLAESYSQKLASSLNRLEKIVVVDYYWNCVSVGI